MQKSEEIILKWTLEGQDYEEPIERKVLMSTFNGLANGFINNNEISKKLIEIIPVARELIINWDNTAETNRLYYLVDENIHSIPIPNAHNIVWAVLKGYCRLG